MVSQVNNGRHTCCPEVSCEPFHGRGNPMIRFLRDTCCLCIFLSIVILAALIVPITAAINVPIVDLPDRTAVFHSSPTKKAMFNTANEDPLLHSLIVLTQPSSSPEPKDEGADHSDLGSSAAASAKSTTPDFSKDSGFKGCRGPTDQDTWQDSGKAGFAGYMNECGNSCMGKYDCVKTCISKTNKFSDTCLNCFADLTKCSKDYCMMKCMMGSDSPKCAKCVQKHCNPTFESCSGFPASDLPARGVKGGGTLLNIEGALTMRRLRRSKFGRDHSYMFSQDGDVSAALSAVEDSGVLGASGELSRIEQDFGERPICRDDDALIREATENEVQSCSQVKVLCEDPSFGKQLRISCPITCNSLSPKCADCKNSDTILQQASGGEVQTCAAAADFCDDRKFGASLMEACPITCDACGVQFSTEPPTPAPITANEESEAQSMVLEKIQDGTFVEDVGTSAIKAMTENPKGPSGAADIWGYAYGMISLATPHVAVKIKPALWPIVWHRPVGFPFDYHDYPPYNGGSLKGAGDAKAKGDDDASRRLQGGEEEEEEEQGQEPALQDGQEFVDGDADAGTEFRDETVDDGAMPYVQQAPESVAYTAPDTSEPVAYTEPVYTDPGRAYTPTTIAHIEFPDETIKAGVSNMVVVGISSHITKTWIDANRDFMEAVAYPIAAPLAKENMEQMEAPDFIVEKLMDQLNVENMGRPEPPTCYAAFGGILPVEGEIYGIGLTLKAEVHLQCQIKLVAKDLAQKIMPAIDCGSISAGHLLKRMRYWHNLWVFGAIWFIAAIINMVIHLFTNGRGCFNDKTDEEKRVTDPKNMWESVSHLANPSNRALPSSS